MFDFIKEKGKISIELLVYKSMQISFITACLLIIFIWICSIRNVFFIKTGLIIFMYSSASLSIWMAFGTIYQWQTLKKAYEAKSQNSVSGFHSIFRVLLGFCMFFLCIYMIFHIITTDLHQLSIEFRKRK